ncbi:MAG: UDP-Glucose 4-empimerase [Parcubacteria group bacterium GW2011_GWA2_51_10]|nr:MAG: UDP-Glucose 4-empimerase [Parcubacteria group bacterium GW2011_GWA2_51_10]
MRPAKRIAVTGSLGYVGSVLAPYLLEKGYEVKGFDTGFFKDALLYPAPPYETIIKDARDITKEDLRGFDAVVHLAAISNDPVSEISEEEVYGPTRDYARAIATLCRELGIDFIFASSCSVYGAGDGELTDERGPVVPLTPYSRNKLAIEEDLCALADSNFSPIALRFATAYGLSPRMRFDLVINMLVGMAVAAKKIVLNSDGTAWRPFIHVEDMAHAFECALALEKRSGLVILNVGQTDENFQIREIAEMIQKTLPDVTTSYITKNSGLDAKAAELVRDRKVGGGKDARTYRVSFERIKAELPGFSPRHTIKESIAEMSARLLKMGFSEGDFKRIGFYRLQRMEELFNSGQVDTNMRWRAQQAHAYP